MSHCPSPELRIYFAISGFLPEVFGGAEVYTYNLARALIGRGHQVTVVTLDLAEHGVATDDSFEGVDIHRLAFVRTYQPPHVYALKFYPQLYDEALSLLSVKSPDVVHITNAWYMSALAMAARHLGIPVVATHVDFHWFCRSGHLLDGCEQNCTIGPKHSNGTKCRACYSDLDDAACPFTLQQRNQLFTLLGRAYSFHHCPCPLMAEHVRSLAVDESRIGVWPYGVPDELVSLRRPKQREGALRLGFIGRFNRIKGIDVLLDAIDLLPDDVSATVDLFGEQEEWTDDSYAGRMARRAETMPRVRLRGRFMPDELPRIHQNLDALVTPSIWPENSPVSILESLTLGTPVICADGEGMTNLIRPGTNGLVFENGNSRDLADQIVKLATSAKLLDQLTSATQRVRSISQDIMEFERIYLEARTKSTETDTTPGSAWYAQSKEFCDKIRLSCARL